DEHFPSRLVVEQLLGEEERAEDVGVLAREAFREHVGDFGPRLVLEEEDVRIKFLGAAIELQDVVEKPVEVGPGRQAGVDERTKVGQGLVVDRGDQRSEEHTSELQSRSDLVCRLLLEKKKKKKKRKKHSRTE